MEKILKKEEEELVGAAMGMLPFSYVPYSRFHVGAALLCADGKIYTGCNIENASYGACNCAERTAVFKAVSEGEKDFTAICIVGGPDGKVKDFCPPCGICRQVMAEFCDPERFRVILARSEKDVRIFLLKELLPQGFGKENLLNDSKAKDGGKNDSDSNTERID